MGDAVSLTLESGTATITLDRPDQRNPLTSEIRAGIDDALDDLPDDVRCVVFEGAGPAFSAGGDIDAMADRIEAEEPPESRVRDLEPINDTVARVARFPAPTVAKVDGATVGAGIALMLACDIQLASARSKFGVVFSHVGLAVDAGTSYFLTKAVGPNVAKELAYTGDVFGAERAADIGLVNHVYDTDDFEEQADDLIERVASGPTVAHKHTKRLVDEAATSTLEEAMRNEMVAGGVVYATADHREGVEAFRNDRDADFEGR